MYRTFAYHVKFATQQHPLGSFELYEKFIKFVLFVATSAHLPFFLFRNLCGVISNLNISNVEWAILDTVEINISICISLYLHHCADRVLSSEVYPGKSQSLACKHTTAYSRVSSSSP